MPKPLAGHAMLQIEEDLVVIGGIQNLSDSQSSSALLKLTCPSGKCNWYPLPQKLKTARRSMVTTIIPDELLGCNWSCSEIQTLFNKIHCKVCNFHHELNNNSQKKQYYFFGEMRNIFQFCLSISCLVTIKTKSNAKLLSTIMSIGFCPNCNQTAHR